MKDSRRLNPFGRFCCTIGNLPTSYMLSLTYEEQLIWFCKYLEETVIPAVNNNAEALEELQNLFIELKTYVDEYFENLDVQEEINNKLDDMAESGQLTDIIAQYLELQGILAYNTVNDMKNATNLADGSFTKTYGKLSLNDGKGHFYKIRELINTDVVDGENLIALVNYPTLVAELINDEVGKLNDLNTINKDTIVGAINEVNSKLDSIPLIFDGDLCSDVDDYIALRLLNWGSKNINIKPLGIMSSVYNDNIAPSVDAMMKFDNVLNVPIGYDTNKTKTQSSSYLQYMTNYPHGITKTENCEDATKLYRKLLVSSKNKVRIVCTGFMLNLANLLKSTADDISDKTGIQLVSEKVDAIFIMGGKYPSSNGSAEYNFANDPLNAKYVCENSPVRLVFSGFENGNNMRVGLPLLSDDTDVKDILTKAILNHTYSGSLGSQCWDAMIMLYALYDNNQEIKFDLIQGTNTVTNNGNNTFIPDNNGIHYYIRMNQNQSYYIKEINKRLWSKKYTDINSSYVNNPTVIGMDGNGKPIYRRFFQWTLGSANQDNFQQFVSFDRIFTYFAGFVNASGQMWPIPTTFVDNGNVAYINLWFDKTNSRIVEKHTYNFPTGKTAYIIVDYTLD